MLLLFCFELCWLEGGGVGGGGKSGSCGGGVARVCTQVRSSPENMIMRAILKMDHG